MTARLPDTIASADSALMPDTAAAVDFLRRWAPDGPWVLTSIVPDGKTDTATFAAGETERLTRWIDERQGIQNVYFHVNPVRRHLTSKASKADMAAMAWLHVDLDPREKEEPKAGKARVLKALREFRHAPTVLIDSGGGVQAFFLLAEPLPLLGDTDEARVAHAEEELEPYNVALAQAFGGDHCHDISRIMRLPGTVNIPNRKKLNNGRVRALARLIEFEPSRIYSIEDFERAEPVRAQAAGASVGHAKGRGPARGTASPPAAAVDVDALRAWATANCKTITDRTLAVIATGDDPTEPGKYADRSRAVYHVACDLVRCGVPDELVVGVLIGPNAIAAHVLGQPQPEPYARRQVQRAHDAVEASWKEVDKDGRPRPSFRNTVTALRLLGLQCSYDVFRRRNIVEGHELLEFVGEFSDQAESLLRRAVHEHFGFDPGKDNVRDAVAELCALYRFDSLLDHLNAMPSWDATPRLDRWLIDYCGAADSAYVREAGATWLLAAVTRAFEPGTKFDHMLVLIGAQGVGKSTALRILAGDGALFSDANFLGARDTREVLEATAGAWIVECAELAGMRRKETETLKHEITKQDDKGRPAYARSPVSIPRRFVLAGTTNSPRFLHDETGNRRFWPVEVGTVKLSELRADRDQIIAEAIARYRAGGALLYLQGEAADGALIAQENRRAVEDGVASALEDLSTTETGFTYKGAVAVPAEMVFDKLGIPPERRRGQLAQDVRRAMEHLGWTHHADPLWLDGEDKKRRAYTRPGPKGKKPTQPF